MHVCMYGCIYTYVYVCIYIYKYVEIPPNRARAHNTRARHKSGSQCLLSEAGRVWYKDGRGMIPGYHKSKRTCANEFMNDMFHDMLLFQQVRGFRERGFSLMVSC